MSYAYSLINEYKYIVEISVVERAEVCFRFSLVP